MPLTTPVCELLGVEHPIGNAGMAGVAQPALCAAVAEAGGIGSVAMAGSSTDEVLERIDAVRAQTARPFNANFIAWLLDHDASPLHAALDAGIASVTISFGDPSPFIERIHAAGSLLLNQVQTLEAARVAAAAGADVIVAQGSDAGGHTGLTPLFPLLPQVVDAAGEVPVMAAGGIGDGRGLAAALMLGAQGVFLGTRFIVADEAESQWPRLPAQVLSAGGDDSLWTTAYDIEAGGGTSQWPAGIGARALRTPWLERWAGHEDRLVEHLADSTLDHAGQHDTTPAYASAVAGMIDRPAPAASIVEDVVAGAMRTLATSSGFLDAAG